MVMGRSKEKGAGEGSAEGRLGGAEGSGGVGLYRAEGWSESVEVDLKGIVVV